MKTSTKTLDHPGITLRRLYLDAMQISNAEFARQIGVSRKTISKLVNGRGGITPKMALRLSRAFNTDPQIWLYMQSRYDLWQVRHCSADW